MKIVLPLRLVLPWPGRGPYLPISSVIILVYAAIIVLSSVLLAGCSSNTAKIPDVYLLRLSYSQPVAPLESKSEGLGRNVNTTAGLLPLHEIRVGFFGICISLADTNAFWLCSNNEASLSTQLNGSQDPLNLVGQAQVFKDGVVFPYFLIIAIVFCLVNIGLLSTEPGWQEELDSEGNTRYMITLPSRWRSNTNFYIAVAAALLALVSALWQHSAAVAYSLALRTFGKSAVECGIGVSAMVLGWAGVSGLVIVGLMHLTALLALIVFEERTPEEDEGSQQIHIIEGDRDEG